MRALVVNADDLGMSPGVNEGILRAHVSGIVTSASLMVHGRAAPGAARAVRRHPALSVGLHLDLGEWTWDGGSWVRTRGRVDPADPAAVAAEAEAQLERFVALTGRRPTHLDSHQHVHTASPAREVMDALGRRLGVPVRGGRGGIPHVGGFHGASGRGEPFPEGIAPANLLRLLDGLPEGWSELGCHPGGTDTEGSYREQRAEETRVLCDPSLPDALARRGIRLASFSDLRKRVA